mgnify:CR=1 FL=1
MEWRLLPAGEVLQDVVVVAVLSMVVGRVEVCHVRLRPGEQREQVAPQLATWAPFFTRALTFARREVDRRAAAVLADDLDLDDLVGLDRPDRSRRPVGLRRVASPGRRIPRDPASRSPCS